MFLKDVLIKLKERQGFLSGLKKHPKRGAFFVDESF